MKRNRKWFVGGSVSIALLVVIGAAVISRNSPHATSRVERASLTEAVYGIGTLKARQSFQLRLGVTTGVKKVFVQEGELVKKGAPLVQLEGSALFHAPFQGTVTSLPYQAGETVFPQTPVLAMSDLRDVYLVVLLDQLGAVRIARGQKARVSFESYREKTLEGKVTTLFSNNDQFIAHIELNGVPSQVLPGMSADVAIEVSKRDNSIVVPVTAISSGKVTVISGGKRRPVPVKVGLVDGGMAEVVEGDLREGDQIMTGAIAKE